MQSSPTAIEPTIETIVLGNSRGDTVHIMTLGGIIREWNVATGEDEPINIILGYPYTESYLSDTAFHGALAGRYCNRIANSRFSLNGKVYQLTPNEGPHQLHGGPLGFNRRHWTVVEQTDNSLTLELYSANGDQGYPGNLTVQVCYLLNDDGALHIDWRAQSDADTYVSITSHGYFNLAGQGDIYEHFLRIPAESYTAMDSDSIPVGKLCKVEDSVLDLRTFTRLGDALLGEAETIQDYGGLDHNYAFGDTDLKLRAELVSPTSQLKLSVRSTLPGLQCYTGNHLQANGIHGCHEGICLEPQYYPDSPNQPEFPSPLLRANETMRHSIRYEVSRVDSTSLHEIQELQQ